MTKLTAALRNFEDTRKRARKQSFSMFLVSRKRTQKTRLGILKIFSPPPGNHFYFSLSTKLCAAVDNEGLQLTHQTALYIYWGADKPLARPTTRCILFGG